MVDAVSPKPAQRIEETNARLHLQVRGVVQGVGFRPFVHRLAIQHGLNGFVRNDNAGVSIEVEGHGADLTAFQHDLTHQPPPMARIEQVTSTPLSLTGARGFAILHSETADAAHTLVSPDIAICDDCLRELFDPQDRRYRYAFVNCTNCGPRYTIVRGVPYDRPLTTMADFQLCPQCQSEYDDPNNRRFHAQPTCCQHCGPQLEFRWLCEHLPHSLVRRFDLTEPTRSGEDALQQAQRLLAHGGVVGVKGIGGFHLACDATNDRAILSLRQRKSRGDKPFAIMARDLASVLQVAHANADEIALLTSRERPIVLLKKRARSPISSYVAPGNSMIGVMLPYSPLHYLLFAPSPDIDHIEPRPWLVMTSANHADEPIVSDYQTAIEQLGDLADALLLHDRPIHIPCDDSVMRVVDSTPLPIRRARGYAPLPIALPMSALPTLAVGGEIKNAFCLAKGQYAFMSQHIGDMQTLETQQSFANSVVHLQKLFSIEPEVIACDLHPAYHSTRWAEAWANDHREVTRLVRVQHHHAHIAALMAEHGLHGDQPVIGICFDGTGYGTDGAIWGGEFMVADYRHFERVAHLGYLPLPGGDATIHKPYRMALAALWAAGIEWDESLPPVMAASATERHVLRRQLEVGLNCVPTSSIGRLFDTVAALCGVCQIANYEAQAAIELEANTNGASGSYHFGLPTATTPYFDAIPLLQAVAADVLRHTPAKVIASRFHNAVADLILEMSIITREQSGLRQVALSGGVFQNVTLLQRAVRRLRQANFETFTHCVVPPNDGGLALGQVMVAVHNHATRSQMPLADRVALTPSGVKESERCA